MRSPYVRQLCPDDNVLMDLGVILEGASESFWKAASTRQTVVFIIPMAGSLIISNGQKVAFGALLNL